MLGLLPDNASLAEVPGLERELRREIDRGFVERTSAAIIVLLAFLLVMNGLAIYLRNRFEKRW